MKAGVTPKLESKWWKDNKDLLVPEEPLGKALKTYEAARLALKKDPSMHNYQQAIFLVREVAEKAKTQIDKCNSLLHKDTIAALKKYKDVVKNEQDGIDDDREKYKEVITTDVEKFRIPAQATLKRLTELEDAVKERMKGAKTAVKDGKGRALQTELASDLKEMATRYTQVNVVSNDLEKLGAKRDYDLVCANPLRDLRKDLEAGRKHAKKTLEALREVIDTLAQKQTDQDTKGSEEGIAQFQNDVNQLARKITDDKVGAMIGLGDVGQIKVNNKEAPNQIRKCRQDYAQYEQNLVNYIKEATAIQRPVALLINKSEAGKAALKKLKEVLAKDAVELKKRCAEVTKQLNTLEEQCATYADWLKRLEKVPPRVEKLEKELKVAANLVERSKTYSTSVKDLQTFLGELNRIMDEAGKGEEFKKLYKEVDTTIGKMPVSSMRLFDDLQSLDQRLKAIVKTGETAAEDLMTRISKPVTFGSKDKK